MQHEYSNDNGENWGDEVTECGFNDVVIYHCPHVRCPVNGKKHARERNAK